MYSIERYRKIVFGVVCGLLAIATFWLALPLWSAFAWGTVLAILVFPLHTKFRDRFGNSIGAALSTLATLIFIIVPLALIAIAAAAQTRSVAAQLQNANVNGERVTIKKLVDDADAIIKPALEQIGVKDFDLHIAIEQGFETFSASLPSIIQSGLIGILSFVFAILLLFFVLRDAHRMRDPVIELMPVPRDKAEAILKSVYDTVHATFFSTVIVALIQGALLGVAFWFLGLPAPLIWAVAGAILSMIPFMGTPILWVPASILLASRGQWLEAIGLALFGAFVIGIVDNILKPFIIGARIKLHPIAVFFAIVGGIVALGPVGVLVGPVLLSVVLGAIAILREVAEEQELEKATEA